LPSDSPAPGATPSDLKQTKLGELTHTELQPHIAEGTALGYSYVLDLAAQEHSPAITVDLIRQLHRHAFGHIYEWAGTFRTHQLGYPLGVSDFWQITEHVRNLCDDLQYRLERLPLPESPERREESIRLVAWFQHRYVQIHPFADFNGRTARMLSALLSLQLGLPAAEVDADEPGEGRKEYVASMQAADGGNLHHLESLLTRAIDQAAVSRPKT
jgi:cell filamentation protein